MGLLKSAKIITTPFADDFNILTRHKISHQKLQDDIQSIVCSKRLTLKPKKCKTLSVVSGKPTDVHFTLTDLVTNTKVVLKTLVEEPHKFLGQILSFKNSSKDHFEFLQSILKTKLENLDSSVVRSEYKVATYDR